MSDNRIKGYKRLDGRFGIRNRVLILPCSLCASETARFASEHVKGTVALSNQGGCSLSCRDLNVTLETLSGIAANPNIYGTVLVGNGCEVVQASLLAEEIRKKTCKPLEIVVIREVGGSIRAVAEIARLAEKMCRDAERVPLVEADLSELILGTECGGSDPTSGLAANPVVGACCDRVVQCGGTVILSETPELIGTEPILSQRCKNREVSRQVLQMIADYEEDFKRVGENPRSGNPTPGNIAGGITTLEEKSLGCIHKAGSSIINEVVGYAEPIHEKGLVVMDTPGQDIASIIGMAAAGAQAVIFSTGHGTPTGSGIIPVIKLTANRETALKMADNIDFDCSGILEGICSINDSGEALFQLVSQVCNGLETKAEQLGFQDVSMARYCNFA